ncbi:hypothetical protein [Naasia sp. SYSU D00948]|uniref:hypothetical protein n=1 Tax=Naasia sp. SYSU D00948 TaxID=2817379 RepID=UPI001B3038E2|nr:hypothetical protein [Naasia sp. SYSU D00948]
MTETLDSRLAGRLRLNALSTLPAAVVALVVLLILAGAPAALPLLVGAAGWMVALVLRQPVALIAARRLPREQAATAVGWFSGPAEELVRLVVVLLLVRSLGDALWAGFGWAAIEVVVLAANSLVIAGIVGRDDPKSREARELLEAQGMLVPSNPFWGFAERLSAIALHLGFTLLLFAAPWLVLLTIPLHSAVNMLAVRGAKRSVPLTEAGLAAVGAAVLVAGLVLVATR